jgi:hypothetical protein
MNTVFRHKTKNISNKERRVCQKKLTKSINIVVVCTAGRRREKEIK